MIYASIVGAIAGTAATHMRTIAESNARIEAQRDPRLDQCKCEYCGTSHMHFLFGTGCPSCGGPLDRKDMKGGCR